MKAISTRKIVIAGVMSAVASFLGGTHLGYIPWFAGAALTIMHVPVIIGTVLEGPLVGVITGLLFGLSSLVQGAIAPTGPIDPLFTNPLISILPRLLIAPVVWLVYMGISRWSRIAGLVVAAVSGSVTNTVLVHDCWRSHFQTGVQTHQLCTAHLLRELNYLEERYDHRWPVRFRKLILDGIDQKKKMGSVDYYKPLQEITDLEKRLKKLLASQIDKKHKELISFQKRMLKYKDFIFTFLYHPKVPPDNNGSERAIRNVKVKQKVSGQFKSWKGVDNFLILRSITDTVLKNKQPVLNALKLIAKLAGTD